MIPFRKRVSLAVRMLSGSYFQRGRSSTAKRSYAGGEQNRLTADWNLTTRSPDAEVQFDIISLRNRCRQLERSNEYVSNALSVIENNVLQDRVAYSLQMKAMRPPDYSVSDIIANRKIEEAWREWCKPKNCSINGDLGFYDICRLALRSKVRDGGVLIRKIIDPSANDFGFALKLIEIDYLDQNYTAALPNGNFAIMGVEKTQSGKVVAYHLLKKHPGNTLFGSSPGNRQRIPAEEIIHDFRRERIDQTIGVPWIAPSMLRLHHLGQYELAELVAAREAAIKGGYFTSDRGDSYKGEKETSTDAQGNVTESATLDDYEPGQKDELPPGMSFTPYDPTHPTQQYGDFVQNALMGISAGMNISYATLTADLRGANYSSMRVGSLQERESWKKIQSDQILHVVIECFEPWLETSITAGKINLPISKFDQFNKPNFKGRRWPWVDPQNDMTATLMAIDAGVSTRTKYTEEMGDDFEEIVATLKDEKEIADDAGLKFVTPQTKLAAPQQAAADDSADSEDDTADEASPRLGTPASNGAK